jgi:hypothetical protein
MADILPINMRVLDGELGDKISDAGSHDFVVPNTFMINDVVVRIRARAGCNPINSLTLICHGIGIMVYGDRDVTETGRTVVLPGIKRSDPSESICRVYGGYGLRLGKEDLGLKNVCSFAALRGHFSSNGVIIIFGCAAADTGPTLTYPDGSNLTGDGPKLMRILASHTGASVIAAARIQNAYQNWYLKTADRVAFNGDTYLFTPDGRQMRNAASY